MNQVQYSNWLYFVFIALFLQGCDAYNAVGKAETIEQRAYAVYGTFVIVEERAASLINSDTLSNSTVLKIADADARAKPVADSLREALDQYQGVRAQLAAGETTLEKLETATANLNLWLERAAPLVNTLKAAVEGAD